jgi:hypothetical protein
MTDWCSFPIVQRGERARVGRTGGDRPLSLGAEWPQTMAGRPTIFVDGVPAPPVTSFASSKSFSRSFDETKAHDMTLAGGASFHGGIFLVVVAVDRALKGCMAGERMNKSFGGEVREKEMS